MFSAGFLPTDHIWILWFFSVVFFRTNCIAAPIEGSGFLDSDRRR